MAGGRAGIDHNIAALFKAVRAKAILQALGIRGTSSAAADSHQSNPPWLAWAFREHARCYERGCAEQRRAPDH